MNYEMADEELQNIAKFEETPKTYRKLMMKAKIAGQPGKYL